MESLYFSKWEANDLLVAKTSLNIPDLDAGHIDKVSPLLIES